ncbi:hypothetical protein Lal_00040964 [Lupinus albus]|nr:hypothetical protein Lal_00040964 [Lupinus albus]
MIEIEDDLVVEILVRLPVKSLLRFKCVDKRWNDLFRKPTFAHRNMKMHEKKKKQCMVICEEREPPRIMISENYEVLESEWKNPFPDDHNVIWPMALRDTYNGVFLIKSEKLYLWNPATREIKLIPIPPSLDPPPPSLILSYVACGLGGDPDTTDFKVFYAVTVGEQVPNPMFQDPTDDDYDRFTITYHPTSFGLYSLSTDTWTLMDFELRRQFKTTAYWNGFLFMEFSTGQY